MYIHDTTREQNANRYVHMQESEWKYKLLVITRKIRIQDHIIRNSKVVPILVLTVHKYLLKVIKLNTNSQQKNAASESVQSQVTNKLSTYLLTLHRILIDKVLVL